MLTDKEELELYNNLVKRIERITTGNVAHERAHLLAVLGSKKSILERSLNVKT